MNEIRILPTFLHLCVILLTYIEGGKVNQTMKTWKKSLVSLALVLPTLCPSFSGPPLLCLHAHNLEKLERLGGMPAHFGLPFF